MKNQCPPLTSLFLTLFLMLSGLAFAQDPVGVVTGLKGKADLTRAGTQTTLHFRDSIILRDVIDTHERSLARILFGGNSIVTVREMSHLEVREEILPTGATRSVHKLSSGQILLNVARRLLRRGDEVQIRTPNAVAAVRGSTIFAQYDFTSGQSNFTVLAGSLIVTPHGRPPITMKVNEAVSITGTTATGIQAGPIKGVGKAQADKILQGSETGLAVTEESNQKQTGESQIEQATALATAVVEAITGESSTASSETQEEANALIQEIEGGSEPADAETTGTTAGGNTVLTSPVTAGGTGGTITSAAATNFTITGSVTLGVNDTLVMFNSDAALKGTPGAIYVVNANVTQSGAGNLIQTAPGVNLTVNSPFLAAETSTITSGGNLLQLSSTLTSQGPFLSLKDTQLDLGGAIVKVLNGSTLTSTVGPAFSILGGSVNADALVISDSTGNTFNLSGTILSLTDTSVTLRVLGEHIPNINADTEIFNLSTGEPSIAMVNSSLTLTGTKEGLVGFGTNTGTPITQGGVGLVASNSSISLSGHLLDLGGVNLTDPNPQIQLSTTTVTHTGPTSLIEVFGPSTVAGPLLGAQSSNLTTTGSLFSIFGGSKLSTSSDKELVFLDGGNHTFGNPLFIVSGLGASDQPISGSSTPFSINSFVASKPIGALFKVTNGADVSVNGGLLFLDSALFEATLPVIEMVSITGLQPKITSSTTLMELANSKVLTLGPVIALDNSLITISNGPILKLTAGTTMAVKGSLLKLLNGSTINVVNGPAILVDGAGSNLSISGALLDFGNTSGNQLIINNPTPPNATSGGVSNTLIPVFNSGGGSTSIGINPIINDPGGNTVSITGAAIEATNGGSVSITAGGFAFP
ncbi:MAG: FecR domain-containing protein [Deltaproteobacteria bacterium]|nr:FecR domain-containing protein [Deltaproteobacteria bacterium]